MKVNPVDEMKKLGLNEYEAKVYLALMERDTLGVSEISKLSKVPRVRTYDILEKLVSRGLATLRPGKHMRYSAVGFDSLGDKLIDQVERRFVEEKSTIQKVTLTLKKQFESTRELRDRNESNSLEYIEIIREYYQIHKRFLELVSQAEKEILNFVKPPFARSQPATVKERAKSEIKALAKGAMVKVIYEIPTDKQEIEWQLNNITASIEDGEQARVIEKLPLKMAVFDERIVMLSLLDPVANDTTFTAQVVEHPDLAKAFKLMFEASWEKAKDHRILEDILKKYVGSDAFQKPG